MLGTLEGRRGWATTVIAAERGQSVAVVGPTQSGKTTALALPAILGWPGPVLAASVKTDLVRDTLAWRRRRGRRLVLRPGRGHRAGGSTLVAAGSAASWAGARRVAADLTEVARGPGTTADGEFWYATAAKLLAPLLFAAAASGRSMARRGALGGHPGGGRGGRHPRGGPRPGAEQALQAARATWLRDDRQRSSVYTTAETVLEPFAEPVSAAAGPARPAPPDIDPGCLLAGSNTLYVSAPAHDQRRLRAVFTALVKEVLDARLRPLGPPRRAA